MEPAKVAMFNLRRSTAYVIPRRFFNADECGDQLTRKALVIGAYEGCQPGELRLTYSGNKLDEETGGKLKELIKGTNLRLGKAQVYHHLRPDLYAVAVSGAGPEGIGFNECEVLDECKENIRVAAGIGAKALQDNGASEILVEGFSNSEAAAEGASLAVWMFQEFKSKDHQENVAKLDLYEDPDKDGWERGILKAEAQNIARHLEDTPANLMTPAVFAQKAIEILCPCGVQVEVRDREWLMAKKLSAFLSIARGSCEPPLFLELSYCGGPAEDKPVVLTGKGITFDSGGLCLYRKCDTMSELRADMAGAAVCVAVMKGLATINAPINVNALIPLCENMPGGMAMKPGDVVAGLSGKTIRLEDMSREGRAALSDALSYAINFKPCLVINIATQCMGMRTALGTGCTGVFTTSDVVWRELCRAGADTGDRVWRFPLWKFYSDNVTDFASVDVSNVGKGNGGEPCLAAAFLSQFTPQVDFAHMDISGTGMLATGHGYPYLRKGFMSGRPTRTLIQFLYQMACPQDKTAVC